MEVGYVSTENIDTLSALFLPDVANQIKKGLPITALTISDGDTAVGAIAGWVDEGEFWIISLYVNPDYRRQGLGKKLVEALTPFLNEQELNMSADIIITSEEHETLPPFFEALGFIDETANIDENTYQVKISDLKETPFYTKNYRGVKTLDEIPEHVLRKAQKMASLKGLPIPSDGLCGEGVERALSTAQMTNGEITSLVAFDRSCVGKLTLACAWGDEKKPAALPALLRASVSRICEFCPDDEDIIIKTINESSEALVQAIAPNAKQIERIYTKYFE